MERIFDIAAVPFEQVRSEETKLYEAKIKETGTFMGYKSSLCNIGYVHTVYKGSKTLT